MNLCGGVNCHIDHYVSSPQANWSIWTQEMIEDSQYVILVCSPTLAQLLREPGSHILDMEKGKYYANTIVNYVQPIKFIPVLLNNHILQGVNPLDWVPIQLHMSSVYRLNISELRSVLVFPEGTPRQVLDKKLRQVLREERFKSIVSLLSHLRGETTTSRPLSPQTPISEDAPNTLKEFPDLTVTRQVARRLKEKWFDLGIKLGVSSFALDDIKKGLSNPMDYESATKEMFREWIRRAPEGKREKRKALKRALVDMKYGRLAEELFQ